MGLRVEILRGQYDSHLNAFHGKSHVTVLNVAGPSDPTEDAPAAELSRNALGNPIIVPAVEAFRGLYDGNIGPMMGGTYAATSDSRFGEATGIYGAVAVHDRFETVELYRQAMAAGLTDAERDQIRRGEFMPGFMMAALREYQARGGSIPSHIGGPAEAIRRVVKG